MYMPLLIHLRGMNVASVSAAAVANSSRSRSGESELKSMERWNKMLQDMDKDHDGKVSCEEYTNFWMEDTKTKQRDDGTFVPGYAEYLIERLDKLTELKKELNAKTPAIELCGAFFDAMDLDGSDAITKEEIMTCATVAFGETEAAGEERWAKMVADMDKDHDGKISRAEYTDWWMKETKSKQNDDGTFAEGYGDFLLAMLSKIKTLRKAGEELYAHQIVDEDVHSLFTAPTELPGGDWQAKSRNVVAEDGLLTAELQKDDDTWVEATTDYGDGDEFTNDDGAFKMTKSGNPPPMTYMETPDPEKVCVCCSCPRSICDRYGDGLQSAESRFVLHVAGCRGQEAADRGGGDFAAQLGLWGLAEEARRDMEVMEDPLVLYPKRVDYLRRSP